MPPSDDDRNPWGAGQGLAPPFAGAGDPGADAVDWSDSDAVDPGLTGGVASLANAAADVLASAVDALLAAAERRLRGRRTIGPDYVETRTVSLALRIEGIMVALAAAEAEVEALKRQPPVVGAGAAQAAADLALTVARGEFGKVGGLLAGCPTVDLVLTLTVLRRHRYQADEADRTGTDYLRLWLDRSAPLIDDRLRLCAWAVQQAEWTSGDPQPDGKPLEDGSALARLDGASEEDLKPSAVIGAAASRSTDWDIRWNVEDTSGTAPVTDGGAPADGADLPATDDNEPVALDGIPPASGDFRIATGRLIAGDRAFRITDYGRRTALGLPALKVSARLKTRPIYQYNGVTQATPSALVSPPQDDDRTESYWDHARAWWTESQAEGGVSALQTAGGLTWGRGFVNNNLDTVVDRWMKACPDVGRALRLIGFVRSPAFKGQWIYLDVQGGGMSPGSVTLVPNDKRQKGTSLGMASKCVVRDLPVLCCLAEIGETMKGNVHQAFCDAQWASLAMSQLLGFDDFASFTRGPDWSVEEWRYVAHTLHWAFNTPKHFEEDYVGPPNARRTTIQRIYTTAGDAKKLGKGWERPNGSFEVNVEGSATMLAFGGGFVRRTLDGLNVVVDAVPSDPPSGAFYIVAKTEKGKVVAYYQLTKP